MLLSVFPCCLPFTQPCIITAGLGSAASAPPALSWHRGKESTAVPGARPSSFPLSAQQNCLTQYITFGDLPPCRLDKSCRLSWCISARKKEYIFSLFSTPKTWYGLFLPSSERNPGLNPCPSIHCAVWSFNFWWLQALNPSNFSILSPSWLSVPLLSSGSMLQIWISYLASLMLSSGSTLKLQGFSYYENTLNKESAFWQKRKHGKFTAWHKHHISCHWLQDYPSKFLNTLLKFLVSKAVWSDHWLWSLNSWNLSNHFNSKGWQSPIASPLNIPREDT